MSQIIVHGGGCCGVRHAYSFIGTPERELDTLFQAMNAPTRPPGRAIEVVLTDPQAVRYGDVLAKLGYIPVFRFKNSNTGNNLTVFFFHEVPLSLENLPFSFDGIKAPKLSSACFAVTGSTSYKTRVKVLASSRSRYKGRIGSIVVNRRYNDYCTVVFSDPFRGMERVRLARSSLTTDLS